MALLYHVYELTLSETVNATMTAQLERCYKGMFVGFFILENGIFNDINHNASVVL